MKSLLPEHFEEHEGNFKTNSEKQPTFCLENSEKCYKSLKLFHTLFFNINSLRHSKLGP